MTRVLIEGYPLEGDKESSEWLEQLYTHYQKDPPKLLTQILVEHNGQEHILIGYTLLVRREVIE